MANLAQRQALRAKIHAATNPGYNTVIGNSDEDPTTKINTAQLLLDRDYPTAPRVGTHERKIYDRLQIASAEWRERNKKLIAAQEAQLEWTESSEYQDAAEALAHARKFADPAVVAKLERCLERVTRNLLPDVGPSIGRVSCEAGVGTGSNQAG